MHLKLSEYQTKLLYSLFFKKKFNFVEINSTTNFEELVSKNPWLLSNKLVCKPDQFIKRRGKSGLVILDANWNDVINKINELRSRGFHTFIVEQFFKIDHEYYICIQSHDNYDEILFFKDGGVDIGDVDKKASRFKIKIDEISEITISDDDRINTFINILYTFYKYFYFTYLEINPLCLVGNSLIPVDFAAKVDNTSFYLWDKSFRDIVEQKNEDQTLEERNIEELDSKTGASLKFKLINPKGSIWTLIAGGGASVVYTDAIVNSGYLNELANYGEYSGNPTSDYVELYVSNVLQAMFKYKIDKPKILFIGGGIANFTDIKKTFKGVANAINKFKDKFIDHNVSIYVRRGGPNYKEGLSLLKSVCEKNNIYSEMYGPEKFITDIVKIALNVNENLINEEEKNNDIQIDNIDIDIPIREYYGNKLFNNQSTCFIYGCQFKVGQRMLDFDYMSNRSNPSVVAFIDATKTRDMNTSLFWKNQEILIPILKSFDEAVKRFPETKWLLNFASFRSAYDVTMKALNSETIDKIAIIAEGIPENQTRKLIQKAQTLKKVIIGPATVGGIKPGNFRIGNTGGSLDNLYESKLYQNGCVSFVTKSGGLLNEMCRIISLSTNGVNECVSIGGDRYPGSNMVDHVYRFQDDESVKIILILGEVGGNQEIMVANLVKEGKITKPVIGWCIGTSATEFELNIQFGHAGASANNDIETAKFKNQYMKFCGINVPNTFEDLPKLLSTVYQNVGGIGIQSNYTPPPIPLDYKKALKEGIVRRPSSFFSSISNETGDELEYNGVPLSSIVNSGSNIGHVVGLLWFKKNFSKRLANYIELILMSVADHGPCTSGSQSTIIAARSGRDMVSSVSAGLLMISDRFGGALNKAGIYFYNAVKEGLTPFEFVTKMSKSKTLIMGIGHRYKNVNNPDKRVSILKKYIFDNYDSVDLKHTQFALNVEKITLEKKNNLILNVDGFLSASLLDAFIAEGNFSVTEIETILEHELLNGFFIMARTCGLIGHWIDQKRLKQGLYRCSTSDVTYLT